MNDMHAVMPAVVLQTVRLLCGRAVVQSAFSETNLQRYVTLMLF